MKFFKKPTAAILLTVILVLASTGVSVNIKLGKKCDEVINVFYSGLKVGSESRPAIADQLRSYCEISRDISVIAKSYDVDVEELENCCSWLENAMTYSPKEIGYIYSAYADHLKELRTIIYRLDSFELSERHQALMAGYEQDMAVLDSNIKNAGYNDCVREFNAKYGDSLSLFMADRADLEYPAYFA